jgi:predicted N-acyltransferase
MSSISNNTEIIKSLKSVDADEWNALNQQNCPFLRHEFLLALENNDAVGDRYGWLTRFITIRDASNSLIGAMPLYEKDNSYGELVFDWAWAEAFHRHGIAYYPKLVSAIPYTPATGQRLLTRDNHIETRQQLIQQALALCKNNNYSSLHCLFPDDADLNALQEAGLLTRRDVQYHWHNPGYTTFDDFLGTLRNSKRKKIRQERKKVAQHEVTFETRTGSELSADDWDEVHRFYASTFEQKSGYATLNQGFWQEVGRTMGEALVIVMAYLENKTIACAINFRSDDVLYGRHWGCDPHYAWSISGLHFETCYYQGIEYAIKNKLLRYEPGAQGEYKMSRGFMPSYTYSAHWISHPDFSQAIGQYLDQEMRAVENYKQTLEESSPYRHPE